MLGSWPQHSMPLEQIKNKNSPRFAIGAKSCSPAGCFDYDKVITVRRFSFPGSFRDARSCAQTRNPDVLHSSGFRVRHHRAALCVDPLATPRNDGVSSEGIPEPSMLSVIIPTEGIEQPAVATLAALVPGA